MNIKEVTLLVKGEKKLAMTSTSEKTVEDRKKQGQKPLKKGHKKKWGYP